MGHGHVIPNKDGSLARCGGPAICSECAYELGSIKPDGNIHTMPTNKKHFENINCWCQPEIVGDFRETGGVLQILHRDVQ